MDLLKSFWSCSLGYRTQSKNVMSKMGKQLDSKYTEKNGERGTTFTKKQYKHDHSLLDSK